MKKIIKYFVPAVAILAITSIVAIRCTKPTDGITVTVNTSTLFHYNTTVQVTDPSGNNIPNNLSVSVTGPDADAIYGLDGKKALVISGGPFGLITAAVHPKMEPTASHPLSFNLVITGPGYLPLIIPVTISAQQKNQILKASIVNLKVTQPGVIATATKTVPASNGTVTVTTSLVTSPPAPGVAATSITIPAGTTLLDANGNVIPASSVAVTANNFNTGSQAAVDMFPGGSLAVSNISGGSSTSAVLIPANFANIQMTAGGVEVKKFSSPINLSMTIPSTYLDPVTGAAPALGSTMSIYSYSTDTGSWKYEGVATVGTDGTNLVVNFTTTHLTEFTVCRSLQQLTDLAVNFTAPWYKPGLATTITVIAKFNNGPNFNIYKQQFQLDSTLLIQLGGKLPVPAEGSSVALSFYNADGTILLGSATIQPNTDGSITVGLDQPSQNAAVTLGLSLDCRNSVKNKDRIIVPPDFYLLYKPTGTPASAYNILGQVHNGTITTTQLDPTIAYDFEAIFNGNVKEVINHKVTGNQSTTVGNASFNGVVVPDQNIVDIKSLCEQL